MIPCKILVYKHSRMAQYFTLVVTQVKPPMVFLYIAMDWKDME